MASYANNVSAPNAARAQHLAPATAAAAATATSTTPNNANTNTVPATVFSSHELAVESVMPGIYLTKNFIAWTENSLRAHGFTHIIIIDKHIQELYYPSPVFKLVTQNGANAAAQQSLLADDPFDEIGQRTMGNGALSFGKEFEAIALNFGEKSYLTTVLPNCYRAVRFINKALQSNGTILVIDCNGGEQKCVTIVVAYLMFKHNISFSNAFARLKEHYKKADLDRFYTSQLYEYEPILQVQRAQSRGHSCSRELHAAILKRKKTTDDYDVTSDFFINLNPLSQFNANNRTLSADAQQQQQQQQEQHIVAQRANECTQQQQQQDNHQNVTPHTATIAQTHKHEQQAQQHRDKPIEMKLQHNQQQLTSMSYTTPWDDYAME